MAIQSIHLNITGMHCTGCEQGIEEAVINVPGILAVTASYARATVEVKFDDKLTRSSDIQKVIEGKGYQVNQDSKISSHTFLRALIFLVLLLVVGAVAFWGKGLMPGVMKQLNAQMSHAMLFTIGFLTGFHCIGMCGSFVVSYADGASSSFKSILAHFSYGFGKTLSYSAIGAGFGFLGAAVTITPYMRGMAAQFASLFLLIYGLKMLNMFPGLRSFSLRLPSAFTRKISGEIRSKRNPLMIGLLTGFLLGCGPLQAMYIMAAGTGSPQEGATLLFYFGLGTLPPLLGFGFFASFLSRNTIHEMVRVSGVLVIVMGLMMADRGLKMTGSGYDIASLKQKWELSLSNK